MGLRLGDRVNFFFNISGVYELNPFYYLKEMKFIYLRIAS